MEDVIETIKNEPIRLVSAIQLTISMLVILDVLSLSAEGQAGIAAAIAAWLALVTRQQVTPNRKLDQ